MSFKDYFWESGGGFPNMTLDDDPQPQGGPRPTAGQAVEMPAGEPDPSGQGQDLIRMSTGSMLQVFQELMQIYQVLSRMHHQIEPNLERQLMHYLVGEDGQSGMIGLLSSLASKDQGGDIRVPRTWVNRLKTQASSFIQLAGVVDKTPGLQNVADMMWDTGRTVFDYCNRKLGEGEGPGRGGAGQRPQAPMPSPAAPAADVFKPEPRDKTVRFHSIRKSAVDASCTKLEFDDEWGTPGKTSCLTQIIYAGGDHWRFRTQSGSSYVCQVPPQKAQQYGLSKRR